MKLEYPCRKCGRLIPLEIEYREVIFDGYVDDIEDCECPSCGYSNLITLEFEII